MKHYYVEKKRHYLLTNENGKHAYVTKQPDGKIVGWCHYNNAIVVFRTLKIAFTYWNEKGYT